MKKYAGQRDLNRSSSLKKQVKKKLFNLRYVRCVVFENGKYGIAKLACNSANGS